MNCNSKNITIVIGNKISFSLDNGWFSWLMVLNTTFNNISVISSWSVLLAEETGVPGENHRPVTSH